MGRKNSENLEIKETEVTEVQTEPVTEVQTEPVTEVQTEPVTETKTEVTEVPTEAETEPVTEPEVTPLKGVIFGCTKLNVRKEASVDSEVLTVINKGEEVEFTETDTVTGFTKVATSTGVEGYCMTKYIKVK